MLLIALWTGVFFCDTLDCFKWKCWRQLSLWKYD